MLQLLVLCTLSSLLIKHSNTQPAPDDDSTFIPTSLAQPELPTVTTTTHLSMANANPNTVFQSNRASLTQLVPPVSLFPPQQSNLASSQSNSASLIQSVPPVSLSPPQQQTIVSQQATDVLLSQTDSNLLHGVSMKGISSQFNTNNKTGRNRQLSNLYYNARSLIPKFGNLCASIEI